MKFNYSKQYNHLNLKQHITTINKELIKNWQVYCMDKIVTLYNQLSTLLIYMSNNWKFKCNAKCVLPLQEILIERGNKSFKDVEQNNLMSIEFNDLVLATGGSAIFSELAMNYISKESTIIFIESSYKDIMSRVPDFSKRGFLKKSEQNIKEAFAERVHLYKYYADFTVLNNTEIDQCVDKIVEIVDKKI